MKVAKILKNVLEQSPIEIIKTILLSYKRFVSNALGLHSESEYFLCSFHSLNPEHQLPFLLYHQLPKLAIVCYIQPAFVFQNALEFSLWERRSNTIHTATRITNKRPSNDDVTVLNHPNQKLNNEENAITLLII